MVAKITIAEVLKTPELTFKKDQNIGELCEVWQTLLSSYRNLSTSDFIINFNHIFTSFHDQLIILLFFRITFHSFFRLRFTQFSSVISTVFFNYFSCHIFIHFCSTFLLIFHKFFGSLFFNQFLRFFFILAV